MHVMKAECGGGALLSLFLTSALSGDDEFHDTAALTPGSLVGPRAGLDAWRREKCFVSAGIEPRSLDQVCNLVTVPTILSWLLSAN